MLPKQGHLNTVHVRVDEITCTIRPTRSAVKIGAPALLGKLGWWEVWKEL